MWGVPSLESLWQDVRYGVRILRRSPMFTVVSVLSLAIGIGASAAVFSLADAVLLRKLPVENPDELVILQWRSVGRMPAPSLTGNLSREGSGQFSTSFSLPTFQAMRKDAAPNVRVFGFASYMSLNIAIDGGSETAEAQAVSGNFFEVLGIAPAAGRLITDADDRPDATPVVLISDAFWQRRFGRSPDAVGRVITVNALPVTIVGGHAERFSRHAAGGRSAKPNGAARVPRASGTGARLSHRGSVVGARDGAAATRRGCCCRGVQSWRAACGEASPKAMRPYPTRISPCSSCCPDPKDRSTVRKGVSETLRIMALIVGIVLLVACAIVANLLLVRGQARGREIAVRTAIGAPRARVVRQLLTEGLLLAVLGSGLGLLVARWIAGALMPALGALSPETGLEIGANWRLVAFTAALATICTALCALVPAVRTTDIRLGSGLQERTRGLTNPRRRAALSQALVAIQVALSVMLLTAAALLVRSVSNLQVVHPGFESNTPSPLSSRSVTQRLRACAHP